jgi:hypothetical protein
LDGRRAKTVTSTFLDPGRDLDPRRLRLRTNQREIDPIARDAPSID